MLTVTSSLRTSSLHPSEPDISTRESWAPEPFAPPLALAETDDGAFRGPFLFWFQRGLAVVTGLRRLQNHARLVSEPDLSLTDRPRPS
jgi:hypothetical protein